MNLRSAAQAVGVLDARILFGRAVGFADLAAFVEMSEIAGGGARSGIGAGVHDAGIECAGTAAKGVKRKRRGDIGGVGEDVGVIESEAEKSKHALGAVEKRETFLGFKRNGRDGGALEGFGAGEFFCFVDGFAFADDDVGQMSERGEIAGGSDGALAGEYWMDACVEHGAKGFDDDGTGATEAFGESVGAEKHHGASLRFAERSADSTGVGAD